MNTHARIVSVPQCAIVVLDTGHGVAARDGWRPRQARRLLGLGRQGILRDVHTTDDGDGKAMRDQMIQVLEDGFREIRERTTRAGCQWPGGRRTL